MAITTQNPNLQLVSGQLGGTERLQAGAFEHLTNRMTNGSYIYIALFSGARPSQEEIDSGSYTLYGKSVVTQAIGVFRIHYNDFTQLAAVPELLREGLPVNDPLSTPYHSMPTDTADVLSTDGYDLAHILFHKSTVPTRASNYVTGSLPEAMKQQGADGLGATWGLVSLFGGNGSIDHVFHETSAVCQTYKRADGRSVDMATRVVFPAFNNYITVGDVYTDPTANLTLYRGAESGLASQPTTIRPHRLRMRMSPLVSSPLGV